VLVLRYLTAYGLAGWPYIRLSRFVQWIGDGRQVIVYGDGLQSRDFAYIDDIFRSISRPFFFKICNPISAI